MSQNPVENESPSRYGVLRRAAKDAAIAGGATWSEDVGWEIPEEAVGGGGPWEEHERDR